MGRQNKVLKLTDKSLIMNLFSISVIMNEMCLSVFIKGFQQKSLIFLLLASAVPILHLVCSFHNSDLIIPLKIDLEFLYLAESSQY